MNDQWLIMVNKAISGALLLWGIIVLVRVYPCLTKDRPFMSSLGLHMGMALWATVFLQALNNLSFVFVDSYNAIDPFMKLTSGTACLALHYLARALRDVK